VPWAIRLETEAGSVWIVLAMPRNREGETGAVLQPDNIWLGADEVIVLFGDEVAARLGLSNEQDAGLHTADSSPDDSVFDAMLAEHRRQVERETGGTVRFLVRDGGTIWVELGARVRAVQRVSPVEPYDPDARPELLPHDGLTPEEVEASDWESMYPVVRPDLEPYDVIVRVRNPEWDEARYYLLALE
jgi:hypothetical protein